MTSKSGWVSVGPVARNGSVTARTSRQPPTTTSSAPVVPATRPRRANGRNWRVRTSAIASAGEPGAKPGVTWRSTWAAPSASRSRPRNTMSSQRLTPIPGSSQRRRFTRLASPRLELPMEHGDRPMAPGLEASRELLGDDDRAVIAAGAADPDREPALAVGLHRRDRELEEVLDELQELVGPGLIEDEFAHRLGQARVLAQLGHVVRVLQEASVEDDVGLDRDPELVAERDELDRHPIRLEIGQAREQALAQVAQRQGRRFDHDVRS